jgi:hypothetical protein
MRWILLSIYNSIYVLGETGNLLSFALDITNRQQHHHRRFKNIIMAASGFRPAPKFEGSVQACVFDWAGTYKTYFVQSANISVLLLLTTALEQIPLTREYRSGFTGLLTF